MFKEEVRLIVKAALVNGCVSASLCSQLVSADGDFPVTKPEIQIRVFNLARVPRRDLSRAQGEVSRIFGKAQIEVHWTEGALDDSASLITDQSANNTAPNGCKVARHARELRLQLLQRAPQGVTPETLGYSLPCAAFGVDATIFIDHCERVTYQTLASFNKVLAYSMAHELGHVLLRSDEHSPTGIMRARWDAASWIRATVAGIPIDREQARRMRVELLRAEFQATAKSSR